MKKLLSLLLALMLVSGLGFAAMLPVAASENPFAPPANLNELSGAEQLEYFNLVVNRVRAERPGFSTMERLRIDDMQFTGAVAVMQPIINSIVNSFMPGEPVHHTVAPGSDNTWNFMSGNPNASALRTQDITAIATERQGENWLIEVLIREELNPLPGLASAHGRIAWVLTREEIIADITSVGPITADPANAAVRYHNGFASVVVNPQGQVLSAANGFQVNAQANNVRIGVGLLAVNTDVTANQTSVWQHANFSWAPGDDFTPPPAPPEPAPPTPPGGAPAPWWASLPVLCQFILRWVFFGWIWM